MVKIRCSASDRIRVPARPAQHGHRRRNNRKGRIPSALASARGRNGKRRVETSNTGRAGTHRPSEALHGKRSSDRAAADGAGALPYRATRCDNASKCSSPVCATAAHPFPLGMPRRIAQERVPTASNVGSRDVTWASQPTPLIPFRVFSRVSRAPRDASLTQTIVVAAAARWVTVSFCLRILFTPFRSMRSSSRSLLLGLVASLAVRANNSFRIRCK